MKKTALATLIFSALASCKTLAFEIDTQGPTSDIVLKCHVQCDPKMVIEKYVDDRRLFYRSDQQITVEYHDEILLHTTIEKYRISKRREEELLRYTDEDAMRRHDEAILGYKIKKEAEDDLTDEKEQSFFASSLRRQSLTCENDPDYTCEEWEQHPYLMEIVESIENSEFVFVVNQEMINGCTNQVNFTLSIMAVLVTAPLVKPVAAYFGSNYLASQLVLVGGAGSEWLFVQNLSELVCSGMEVDSVITVTGGEHERVGSVEIVPDGDGGGGDVFDTFRYEFIPEDDYTIEIACQAEITGPAGADDKTITVSCFFV